MNVNTMEYIYILFMLPQEKHKQTSALTDSLR